LTSQIFANIYLNELDQFVTSNIKPLAYLRYGDDFIIIMDNYTELAKQKKVVVEFINNKLRLTINSKNDIIIKAKYGLKFLGVEIFPKGRRLKKRNWRRAEDRLNLRNVASYKGLVDKHGNERQKKYYNWVVMQKIIE